LKRLKNILLSKKTIIIISLFLLLYIIYAFFVPRKSKYSLDDNTFICTVENIYIKDYYKLDLSCKEKITGYSYNELDIEIGDVIKVTGNLKEIESYNNFNIFNYKNYMNNQGSFFNLNIENITIIRKSRGLYKLKSNIINRVNNLKSFSYINSLVLGDKSYIDDNILSIYKSLGIMHIFAISGMHLNILINTFNKIFRKKNIFTGILLLLLLFLYYLLVKSVSLLRAFIYYLISCINNKYNISLTIYHKLFYLFAIMIFINPYFVFSSSFLYSYFISSFLIVMGKKINSLSNYFLKLLLVSFLSFIIAFPLNIYFYYEVNIFSLISNLFAVPYVSFILFPLCLLVIIFPFLDEVLFVSISNFQNICVFLTSFNILLIFKKSLIITLLYYLLFLFIKRDKKGIIILIFLLLVHYNYNSIFKSSFVNYIDQTTPNMIQRISGIFERNPLISKEI